MGYLELAVAALRREMLPVNPRWFAVIPEGPIEHIWKLRREIDEYPGLRPPNNQSNTTEDTLNTATTELG